MNTKASVTIKTPMGDTYPLILSNLVKQGTVLGPVLNNCSLDRFSKESFGYNFGSVGVWICWSLLMILLTQAAAGRLLC